MTYVFGGMLSLTQSIILQYYVCHLSNGCLVDVIRLTVTSYVRQVHCLTSFHRRLALLFPSSLSLLSKEDFRGSLLTLFVLFVRSLSVIFSANNRNFGCRTKEV